MNFVNLNTMAIPDPIRKEDYDKWNEFYDVVDEFLHEYSSQEYQRICQEQSIRDPSGKMSNDNWLRVYNVIKNKGKKDSIIKLLYGKT